MITKYKQFNESIKNLLKGPTEEEAIDNLNDRYEKDEINISDYVIILVKNNMVSVIDDIIKIRDFDDNQIQWILSLSVHYKSIDIVKYILDNYNLSKNMVKYTDTYSDTPSDIKDMIKKYLDK